MPAFLFDDRQSRQVIRMILIILLGVNILHARFILLFFNFTYNFTRRTASAKTIRDSDLLVNSISAVSGEK